MKITIPTLGDLQEATCIPLRKLAGWLMTIYPNKVKPEIRNNITRYQNECDDVLWQYWTEGKVTRGDKTHHQPQRKALATETVLSLPACIDSIKTIFPNLGERSLQSIAGDICELDLGRRLIPMPLIEEKYYTALEIAEEIGTSAQMVGRVANSHGLKTEEFGEFRLSKSCYSSKQVEQFYYNEKGREALILAMYAVGEEN